MRDKQVKTATAYALTGFAILCLLIGAKVYRSAQELKTISELSAVESRLSLAANNTDSNAFVRRVFPSVAPYLAVGLVLSLVACRMTIALVRTHGDLKQLTKENNQEGATAVEFILVFPLLLIMLLTILQVALIVQARFVVNYAAFCAARSAIVTIPARVKSRGAFEDHNVISTNNPESPKMRIIQRSAALPCVGISPLWSAGLVARTQSAFNPRAQVPLAVLALFAPGSDYFWQLQSRAPYAYDQRNTSVGVSSRSGGFKDHSEVTVQVTHRYYLTVPFADRLLGRSYTGAWFGLNLARYLEIKEQYTLLNEGEPSYPESQQDRFGDSDVEVENY